MRGATPDAVDIRGRRIGAGAPCFVIAEAGVNHNGSVEMACRLVDAARHAGADAVKFQTFTADKLATADAPKAAYQQATTGTSGSQLEMLRRLQLSRADHVTLLDHCDARQIQFLSSPFDEDSADLLEALGVPAFKVSSGELTNLPLLAHIARKGRTMIVSTGMARLGEVEAALGAIRSGSNCGVVLLQCVSNYPADPRDVNLRAMHTMSEAFQVAVGYSDHTTGRAVALAAVALGACVIEKHFTLDCTLPGPDHRASIEPDELSALVTEIRTVEAALGDGAKVPAPSEADTAAVARRSLVAAADIAAGATLSDDLVETRRPGTGLPPAMRPYIIGRVARVAIPRGAVIGVEMLA